VLQTLRYLGWSGESFADFEDLDAGHSFVGLELDVRCDHDEYQGKTRERWNIERRGGGDNSQAMGQKADRQLLRKLDAKFAKVLKAHKVGNAVPVTRQEQPTSSVNGQAARPSIPPPPKTPIHDEIPF
jgi:hypothetical protein